jgi:exonuclease SbcC
LGHANAHLARMTGGRYQLRLRDRSDELRARGLELDVEDRHAGGARRRVATLSGGESFQASLALALGLSEAAERTSGAVELGALFIDEGFGSLDAHALDGVVRILRELPLTQRRMVGVITHVDELKRRIEAQLLVTRDALGSRVEVRRG